MKLRTTAKPVTGYLPQGFCETSLTKNDVKALYPKLARVPNRINAYFEGVVEAYKDGKWNYFVLDTEQKVWIIEY